MKKIRLFFSLILLSNALFGCQQRDNEGSKSDKEILSKENNGEYDIEGIVSQVSNEEDRE